MEIEKKGTHIPKYSRFVDFLIGCDALESVQDHLKNMYNLGSGKMRGFVSEGYMNLLYVKRLKRRFYFHEILYDEDVIRNCSSDLEAL